MRVQQQEHRPSAFGVRLDTQRGGSIAQNYLLPIVLTLAACSTPPWNPIPIGPGHSVKADMDEFTQHLFTIQPKGGGDDIDTSAIQQLAVEELGRPVSKNELMEGGCFKDKLKEQFICVIDHFLTRRKARKSHEQPLNILFYFNGGMNDQPAVLGTAWHSFRQIEDDGYFPVFMIWPTGARDAYIDDVAHIRSGRRKPNDWSTVPTTILRLLLDFTRGLASTPQAWGTALTELETTNFGLGSEEFTVERDRAILVSDKVDANHNLYYSDDVDRAAEPIVYFGMIARDAALAPFRVISTPLIGPGEAGWRNMVRRTRTSVRAINEFPEEFDSAEADSETRKCSDFPGTDNEDRRTTVARLRTCFPLGAGGFARFFQWLQSCATGEPITKSAEGCPLEDPGKIKEAKAILSNIDITIVGHSMGTIVINELMQLFPDLPYKNLVYMAGAASVRDTARAVSPILRDNRGCTKFYNLMLHPMNDARERTGAGFLLSGSLLHYVDEFLESPKTLPDRTVGQWRNIKMTRHLFPAEARKWMIFHVFDREAKRVAPDSEWLDWNPTAHGHFNDPNMPYWRKDFWKPANVQFSQPDADVTCEDLFSTRLAKAEKAPAGS